jgi:phosphoribosylamine--glycine ligase
MKLLVLGGGGREHALAWRLSRDAGVRTVFCAPGNAGTADVARAVALDPCDPESVLAFVEQHDVRLTIVGPELPLTRGVVDALAARGRLAFGPTSTAAQIESSKVFAKEFMQRYRVPTAESVTCSSADEARATIDSGRFPFPVVVKADGLAAGKGVVIARDRREALDAIESMMIGRAFGAAGERVLVEEYLEGRELSFFAICDGTRAVAFHSAEDHKRAFDNDVGPNTGGMGAFAPSPLVDSRLAATITSGIIEPTVEGMRAEGRPFRGFLYAGLILTAAGPKVLEFNARLGDPEAQVVLPMLGEDLLPLLLDAASGSLTRPDCRFSSGARAGVVLASAGYPGKYETGAVIRGLVEVAKEPGTLVFHSGTRRQDGDVVTSGGRVLTIVGSGPDHASAIASAYRGVSRVSFEGMHHRTDIGAKALSPRSRIPNP